MNPAEHEHAVTLALMAAFADGSKAEAEHEAIRNVAEGFAMNSGSLATLYQKVLLKQVSLESAAAAISSEEGKELAYQVARCVCEADGPPNAAEVDFLSQLQAALAPTAAAETSAQEQAEPETALTEVPAAAAGGLDPLHLKYAVLASALELLPQATGSLAIVPVQMKLVYDVAKKHSIALDRQAAKDFAAALGIGAVGQVLEAGLRKLLSGVLGGVGGATGERVGDAAGGVAGTALTFATTVGLGAVADRYFASGRNISLEELKAEFTELVAQAKVSHQQYAGVISEKARELTEKLKGLKGFDFTQILGKILPGGTAAS